MDIDALLKEYSNEWVRHSDRWSPYEEEARELAMLAGNARENPRYQVGLVFTLHSVSIHVYMTTRAYPGTNRIGNPVGETLQHIKGDIICHRLTRQLMYIVQVKFHRVYFEIWMRSEEHTSELQSPA